MRMIQRIVGGRFRSRQARRWSSGALADAQARILQRAAPLAAGEDVLVAAWELPGPKTLGGATLYTLTGGGRLVEARFGEAR
jgi:hypothetical protein